MLKVLGFLLLFHVCLLSSQYLSSFYVTDPKWYNAYVYDSNAITYLFYGGYSLAQVHCARKCSQFDNCVAFSIYGWDMQWTCSLINNSYCVGHERILIGLSGIGLTWDKIKDTPNNASSCIKKSGILNSGNSTDYCQFIRPGCFGENCTNCPSSCSGCFQLKNMSTAIDHECSLWIWNYTAPPIPGVKCYGSSQYALARKLNRTNGQDISEWTIRRPYQPQNFTWLQGMASASTQAHFVLSGEPFNNNTYEAIYKKISIFQNGTLRMSFVSGNAGDGFNFGSNDNGNISLQFVWPSDISKCGPYWYKTSNGSCPTDRVILWDDSDFSNNYYGIRWPTLSATYNMSVFKLYFAP